MSDERPGYREKRVAADAAVQASVEDLRERRRVREAVRAREEASAQLHEWKAHVDRELAGLRESVAGLRTRLDLLLWGVVGAVVVNVVLRLLRL